MKKELPGEYQVLGFVIAILVLVFFGYLVANAFPGGLDWENGWFTINDYLLVF